MDLNGIGQGMSASNAGFGLFPGGNAPFSISFWFKADALPALNHAALLSNENYLLNGFRCSISSYGTSPKISFWSSQSGGTVDLLSKTTVQAGKWYHVVVSYELNNARLYVDGREEAVDTTALIKSNANPLLIGYGIGGHLALDGSMDEVKVFHGRLTSQEVQALFDSDGDGMPDLWEAANGLNPSDNGDATFNPDGDERNNLGEYLDGTDPQMDDGIPDYLLCYMQGQIQMLSHDLKLIDGFAAPSGAKVSRDPRGGFWLSYVNAGKATLRYYNAWNQYQEIAGIHNATTVRAVRWSTRELLLVYQYNGINYLTVYNIDQANWGGSYRLVDENGNDYGLTTTFDIFGLERLASTGKIFIQHAPVSSSSFSLSNTNPGRRIQTFYYTQTGFGNGIETVLFSDTQLVTIDKNYPTYGGHTRVWNPEALTTPSQTYTYINQLSSTYGNFTSLIKLKDGRLLAGSGTMPNRITEVDLAKNIRHVDLPVSLFHDNHTGSMVEVHDTFGDKDHDDIPDLWELNRGLDPNNPADAALDPDYDGLSNLDEYQQGSDPNDYYSQGALVIAPILQKLGGDGQVGRPSTFTADPWRSGFSMERHPWSMLR
ncbi:MAG: LamG domain-containing protein [Blastochloris sp.]|nr:LamG domain-containing protein [Blastochloris sp.]